MREITAVDYVQEVNKAGDDVFVILHLYKQGVPLSALINEYMNRLAPKFPTTKFLKAISTTCIPNYQANGYFHNSNPASRKIRLLYERNITRMFHGVLNKCSFVFVTSVT